MRRRQLKWLWKRLRELAAMEVPREEMLMKLGAVRSRADGRYELRAATCLTFTAPSIACAANVITGIMGVAGSARGRIVRNCDPAGPFSNAS
jgi:hypothetical protein